VTRDHAPGLAEQRAVLAAARAILTRDDDAAHHYAGTGNCPQCTVVSSLQFGFALAAQLTGRQAFVDEGLRRALLDAVNAAQAEVDDAPN
jgi:hypothetical protein